MRTMRIFKRSMSYAEFMERKKKILELADAMIDNDWSCWKIEKEMGVSHSTTHRYLTKELPYLDDDRYVKCKAILKEHKRSGRDDRTD